MPLNVCICGWHYADEWYASLLRLQDKDQASPFVVAHREHPLLRVCGLAYLTRPNAGLEWGAYNHYLQNIWERGHTVYSHDDVRFNPVINGQHEVVSGEDLFPRLAKLTIDQGYIFRNRQEDAVNYGKHGRMVFISDRLQRWCRDQGGFWHDDKEGWPEDYNTGITKFVELMDKAAQAGFDVANKIYYPGLEHGYRGEFKGGMIQ